ncbi:MAG: hypothetical protein ABIP31_11760 [Chitinophagaceae bacterium]
MKQNEKLTPAPAKKKTGPGSNPVNKFKKGQPASAAAINNIITGPVENVKARSSGGFANNGTVSDYNEEH